MLCKSSYQFTCMLAGIGGGCGTGGDGGGGVDVFIRTSV